VSVAVVLAAGAVIGLSLGALGGGGSILTVPVLVYGLGQSAAQATTGSLLVVGVTALVGAVTACCHRRGPAHRVPRRRRRLLTILLLLVADYTAWRSVAALT
jgi:uncharacterized membrane protein YfcA